MIVFLLFDANACSLVKYSQQQNSDMQPMFSPIQVRAFSCLFGKAREMNYAIPDDKAWAAEGKFEGATVLEPKKGAYFTPIAALDFAR